MFSYILIIIIAVLVILHRWKNMKHIKLYNQLKMDLKCYPVIGHSYLLMGSDEDRMNGIQHVGRIVTKNGGVGTAWFANKLYSVLAEPEAAEVILKNCSEKDFTMKFLDRLLGNGTIIAPVPIWRVRRKILSASFSVKNLNGFVDVFSRHSKIMVELLKEAGSQPFSILKYLAPCAMDVVYECILGIKIGTQNSLNSPVIKAWDDFRDSVTSRACRPWLHPDWVYNLLSISSSVDKHKSFLEGISEMPINRKMKKSQNEIRKLDDHHGAKLKTFLEDLIRTSQRTGGYRKSELVEETFVLTFASSDSSTVGTSFTCLMLARYPEIQEKVFLESQEVFGDDDARPVTPEDLLKLKYLEAVIKETLRLYPPIPIIVREILDDIQIPSGVTLLKDTGTLIHIWAIHRNPRYWGDDAEEFKPERFLDLTLKHPAQYMPFSYGPRNCLGPQFAMTLMKTLISSIVRKYKILPASSKVEPLRLKFDLTMKDVNEFSVRLEPRLILK